MKFKKKQITFILGIVFLFTLTVSIFPGISIARGIRVKVLYDFSGSMYPGYPDHRRHELGVNYFHKYDSFKKWLADFIATQTRFNAKRISMSTFSSGRTFQPSDIKQVHPPVETKNFNVNKALSIDRPRGIDYTYLAESLDHFTRDNFEGLVWVITDNRVETGGGGGTTRDFFVSMRDTERYRSIYIYNYLFEDKENGQEANLAVYGILVSQDHISLKVSQWYDQRFDELKNNFIEKQYMKLKDLSVDPIEVKIGPIEVDINTYKKGTTEGKVIKMALSGTIRSKLTQHTILDGRLIIEAISGFTPDPTAQKKYGIKTIPWQEFKRVSVNLSREIPPGGIREIKPFYLESKKPVSLSLSGLGNLIQAGTNGVRVKYSGKGIVSSDKLDVAIKKEGRKRITNIYSSEDIEPIFGPLSTITKIKAKPSQFDISFIVKTGSIWGAWLFLLLLLFLLPIAFLIYFMSRKESYKIRKGADEEIIRVRRLQKYDITDEGVVLGVLKRNFGDADTFSPNTNLASLNVSEGKKNNEFNVEIGEKDMKKSYKLSIEPMNESRSIEGRFDAVTPSDSPGSTRRKKGGGSSGPVTIRKPSRKANVRKPG
jgi:hypothetical protein